MTDAPPFTRSEPAAAVEPAPSPRRRRRQWAHSPHAPRFRAAIVILSGMAIAAVVAAILIASHGRGASSLSSMPWSLWKPADGGTQGAREIADYIAPTYEATPAVQLAVVTVVNVESAAAEQAAAQAQANGTAAATQAGVQIAIRPSATSSQVSLLGGNTIAYNLCGINDSARNCAIGVGKPSMNRLLLLRREALELALYTFKYIGATNNVLVVLPPGREQATSTSASRRSSSRTSSASKPIDIGVLFQRQELASLLTHPVDLLLPEGQAPTVAEMPSAPEAALVRLATAHGLFSEQLQHAQDGSSIIVLAPLPAQ